MITRLPFIFNRSFYVCCTEEVQTPQFYQSPETLLNDITSRKNISKQLERLTTRREIKTKNRLECLPSTGLTIIPRFFLQIAF